MLAEAAVVVAEEHLLEVVRVEALELGRVEEVSIKFTHTSAVLSSTFSYENNHLVVLSDISFGSLKFP